MESPETRKHTVPPAGDTASRDPKMQEDGGGGGASKSALEGRIARCLRLFMEDPAGLPAFRSAEDLLKEAQAWEKLLEVYDRRVEAIANPVERANLLARKGHLLEGYLSRPDEALVCYRAALVEHPVQADAQRRLVSFFETEEQWDELAALLEASVSHLQNARDRAALYLRLAALYAGPLAETPGAIDRTVACHEQILALGEDCPDTDKSRDALLALYRKTEKWEALVEALQAVAATDLNGIWTGIMSLERPERMQNGVMKSASPRHSPPRDWMVRRRSRSRSE